MYMYIYIYIYITIINIINTSQRRKRNIIWFNPPFSKSVSTNIGKYFLNLLEKHFHKNHKYRKLFNRNNVKLSYSCMPNTKSIINNHNKNVLQENNNQNKTCNCIKKESCPLGNQCLTPNIVYQGTISSNEPNTSPKIYIGLCEESFKKRYANHKKSFNHSRYENDTELSKEYWKLKERKINPVITLEIKTKCDPFNPTSGKCSLCLNEKLLILEASDDRNLLNKRNELVSKCRHQNKFKLSSLKTDVT